MNDLIEVQKILSSILRHDKKLNNYKLALIRGINDVALAYAGFEPQEKDVAVPLRLLADFWIGYYWPFMSRIMPVLQGPRVLRDGVLRSDMAFRESLTLLKEQWQVTAFGSDRPSDGMVLVAEMQSEHLRSSHSPEFFQSYLRTRKIVASSVEYPIQYAGLGNREFNIFKPAALLSNLGNVSALPGTSQTEKCVVIPLPMWEGFKTFSLWIEALCIHEWSLFIETVRQEARTVTRGEVYQMVTDRPDSRRPLTWERNQVELLMLEGHQVTCMWTGRTLNNQPFDMDHIIPISLFPINETWNLVPSEPNFNSHVKAHKMPDVGRKAHVLAELEKVYTLYRKSIALSQSLERDTFTRFNSLSNISALDLSKSVVAMVYAISDARNAPRF